MFRLFQKKNNTRTGSADVLDDRAPMPSPTIPAGPMGPSPMGPPTTNSVPSSSYTPSANGRAPSNPSSTGRPLSPPVHFSPSPSPGPHLARSASLSQRSNSLPGNNGLFPSQPAPPLPAIPQHLAPFQPAQVGRGPQQLQQQQQHIDAQMNAMLANSLRLASNSNQQPPLSASPQQASSPVGPRPPTGLPHRPPIVNSPPNMQSASQLPPSRPFIPQSGMQQQQQQQQQPFAPMARAPSNPQQSPPSPLGFSQQQQQPPQQPQHPAILQGPDTFLPIHLLLHHFTLLISPYLAPTLPNSTPTQDEMVAATVKYLTFIAMPPRDFSISRHPQQGFVARISFRGIKVLERAVDLKKRENAAVVFQKCWRRILAVRRVKRLLKEKASATNASSGSSSTEKKRSSVTSDTTGENKQDKAERRKSKITAFKSHLYKVSNAYEEIINNTNTVKEGDTPAQTEVEFMRLMNTDETFRLSVNLRAMHKLEKSVSLEEAQRNYEAQGGVPGRSPAQMYHDYSPRVVDWILAVLPALQANNTTTDLVTLLRPADVLCQLAIQMFPHVQCKLLNKGAEFTIHKAVFFLELCKTVGVKPGMLFSLKDLFLGGVEDDPTRKCGLTVLRTVCALERQARRKGWDGPVMVLKVDRASLVAAQAQAQSANPTFALSSVPTARLSMTTAPRLEDGMEEANSNGVIPIGSLTKRGSKIQGRSGINGHRISAGIMDPNSKEGKRKSALSSRSSKESIRASQLQQQQQYVTALPSEFKSLSRDEKVTLLVALPAGQARESLRILYQSQAERFEYEDLMAVVWEKENTEIAKKEEHEKRVRAAVQVRESLAKRNQDIFSILKDEESHLSNLMALSEFLENTVTYRLRLNKRRSRGLPTLVQLSPTKQIDIYAPTSPTETTLETTMRVEYETEDLILLDRILKELVEHHKSLIEDLKYSLEIQQANVDENYEQDVVGGVVTVGDLWLKYAADVSGLCITYSAVALTEASVLVDVIVATADADEEAVAAATPSIASSAGEESSSVSFFKSVASRFIGSPPGGDVKTTVDEIKWYLSSPVRRLAAYRALFGQIVAHGVVDGVESRKGLTELLASDHDVGAEWRKFVKEDRKLEIAGVKLGSVSDAISLKLGVAVC
ncbi:UNVERIFIED_CONTAM: hypothetical protein HDU68_002671 [Siphonaria sp. JEL0065]|nr:hypothetical protein HDU68_002671 [Siphonaria sp. JEL0065]